MVINTIINEKNGACRFYSQTFMHGINFLGKLFTNKKEKEIIVHGLPLPKGSD